VLGDAHLSGQSEIGTLGSIATSGWVMKKTASNGRPVRLAQFADPNPANPLGGHDLGTLAIANIAADDTCAVHWRSFHNQFL
jgi:hypothetical protein